MCLIKEQQNITLKAVIFAVWLRGHPPAKHITAGGRRKEGGRECEWMDTR